MKRKIFISILIAIIALIAWNRSLIGYGLNQGYGQLNIIWKARPIREALDDPAFPDSLKRRLLLVAEVRKYAIDTLGLKDTDNYQTLYDQKGEEVMWVVTGCDPFEFKPKLWDFPVLGEVPYKGFFDRDKAIREAKRLEAEGWDVGLRNPSGWSTLGWFTDPILSGMLNRSDGDLASLIIHEMVHATLFVKDSVDFNENLASFIADTAAYHFLAHKYGRESEVYQTYRYEDIDHVHYSKHVLRGALYLDSLYATFRLDQSKEEKLNKKKAAITSILESMDTLTLHRFRIPPRFKERLPNNDYFMNYKRYQSKQSHFRDELIANYGGDLRKMITDYQEKYPFL
jgi:predicted aminopeptidase